MCQSTLVSWAETVITWSRQIWWVIWYIARCIVDSANLSSCL
jgi:hypothetical protein